MRGVITTRDVVIHLGLIWREFGPGCFLRCLRAIIVRKETTFLDVMAGAPSRRSDPSL